MQFSLNTDSLFQTSAPEQAGSINLLFSGTIDPLSIGADFTANPPTWDTGSWNWGDASVGRLSDGVLKGIVLTNYDLNGSNNLTAFKSCTELSFLLDTGDSSEELVVPVLDKVYYPTYTYFKVDLEVGRLNCNVYFYKDNSDNFLGYSCTGFNGNPIVLSIYPNISEYEVEEVSSVDPLINNAVQSRLNSSTQKVEVIRNRRVWTGQLGRSIYDGEDVNAHAPWDAILNGGNRNAAAPYTVIANANGAGVPYYVLEDSCTGLAEIPDSFYTRYGEISGKFIGSKQSLVKWFTSSKEGYTEDNLEIVSGSATELIRSVVSTVVVPLGSGSFSGSNLSGSIQFTNLLHTGSLGTGSGTSIEYLYVDCGISMSVPTGSVEGRVLYTSMYVQLSGDPIIGTQGVNTYGQITVPTVSGSFASGTFIDAYVDGVLDGEFIEAADISGTITGTICDYTQSRASGSRGDKCASYDNSTVTGSIDPNSNAVIRLRGNLRGLLSGSVEFNRCEGQISTDSFTGNLVGHIKGLVRSNNTSIYSIKGNISGSLDISPEVRSQFSGSEGDGNRASTAMTTLEPVEILQPQFTYEQTDVFKDYVANIPTEMAYYNTVSVESSYVFPVKSKINYIDDVEDLIANKSGYKRDITFMIAASYISYEDDDHKEHRYLYTEKTPGLELAEKDFPKVGDVVYYKEKRLGSKKIYLPENTTYYTTDYNGQVKEVVKLEKRPNTVILTSGSIVEATASVQENPSI